MTRVILVPGSTAESSITEAIGIVTSMRGTVVARDSNSMLAEIDGEVSALAVRLRGWIVSIQSSKIPVPDTRLKVRKNRTDAE